MKTCPQCDGAKTITFTIRAVGELEQTSLPCPACDGKGEVTDSCFQQWQADQAMWCDCDNPSGEVEYFSDGQHADLPKLHYRCKECGGVTQIG